MIKYLILKKINDFILTSLLLIGGYIYLQTKFNINISILIFLLIFILIFMILSAIFNYKTWEYVYDKSKLSYKKGFFTVITTTLPITQIEQIEEISNPLLDKMNLVNVRIITTSKVHELLPISKEESREIHEFITKIINLENRSSGDKHE